MVATLPLVLEGGALEGVVGLWNPAVGIFYRFDGLAWMVNLLGFSVAGAAWIYSLGSGPKGPAFTAVFLIQTSALAATSMTADIFNLFVCLEVMGIASYVLIASSDKPGSFLAAFSYLMVSGTAMVFFLLGIYGFYRLTGYLSYQGIATGLASLPNFGGVTGILSLALITAAVAIRVAIMPLYGWLPDSHALAPHPVSAVLSGVLIKTPLFALSRVLLLLPLGAQAGELMGYAGAITALVAVVIALAQKDSKRLLAYHTVSQIGYVVAAWGAAIAVGVHTSLGALLMAGAFLHALFHALFKGLLFLSVGTATDTAGERNVYQLRGAGRILGRAGERFPVTTLTFFVAALAITAMPPMNGFASKTFLTYGLKGTWQYSLLFAASLGTMASFIKLSRIFWPPKKSTLTEPVETNPDKPMDPVHPARKIAQGLLALACIGTGLGAPALFALTTELFSSGPRAAGTTLGALARAPQLYSVDTLQTTLWILIGGIMVFLGAGTPWGSGLLRVVRERPRSFRGLFVSFSLGVAGLSAWLLFI